MPLKSKVFSLTAARSRFCCMAISPSERIVALRGSGSGVGVGSGVGAGRVGVASTLRLGLVHGRVRDDVRTAVTSGAPPKGWNTASTIAAMRISASTASTARTPSPGA